MIPWPATLKQAVWFLAVAGFLGLLGNALHPRGLDIGRDHFPRPEHGYPVYGVEQVENLVTAAQTGPEILILDARKRPEFLVGHLPGARHCDSHRQEKALPTLRPLLKEAFEVVVYCAGGDCEDSIFLATDLVYREGVDPAAIRIFEGGMEAWRDAGKPVEKGTPGESVENGGGP